MSRQKGLSYFISIVVLISLILSLAACGNQKQDQNQNQDHDRADELLEEIENRLFRQYVTEDSLSFHLYMKDPESLGFTPIEPTWGDYYTLEYHEKSIEDEKLLLSQLNEINENDLQKEGNRILYKTLKQNAELTIKCEDYYYYDEPFHVMSGEYINCPLVMAEFEFRKQADIDTYIALLKSFGEYIDRQIAYEKEKAELGLFMPDFVLDQVIEQCEGNLDGTKDGSHFLFDSFNLRLDTVDGLTDEQKDEYKAQNKEALTEYFFPVYDKIIEELSALRGSGSAEITKERREYFLLELQSHTSSDFTPEYIVKLLGNEMDRSIMLEMMAYNEDENVFEAYENGALTKGSVEQNIEYLKSVSTAVFPELPEHDLDVSVLPESMRFLNSAAYYMSQPVDDYYDNIIRVNPSSVESDNGILFVLAHEGYGGHLLESVYSGANNIGNLRRILSAVCYAEGFANYGASCVLSASDFDKPLVDVAISERILDAALGARIEIGIFCEGWTEDNVRALFKELYGLPEEELGFAKDYYESMYAYRGTMCRYGVGIAFFNKLRNEAEEELGNKFDELEFNTRILEIGSCHLNTLEEFIKQ